MQTSTAFIQSRIRALPLCVGGGAPNDKEHLVALWSDMPLTTSHETLSSVILSLTNVKSNTLLLFVVTRVGSRMTCLRLKLKHR